MQCNIGGVDAWFPAWSSRVRRRPAMGARLTCLDKGEGDEFRLSGL